MAAEVIMTGLEKHQQASTEKTAKDAVVVEVLNVLADLGYFLAKTCAPWFSAS